MARDNPLAGAVFQKEDAVIEASQMWDPLTMDCVAMFKLHEIWKLKFKEAPGCGKALSKTVIFRYYRIIMYLKDGPKPW